MGEFITTADLAPFATIDQTKAEAMIADAEALAVEAAPCIAEAEFTKQAAVKAILRGALLRWNDQGTGTVTSTTAGPFGRTVDTSQPRRRLFWPSEIEDLQKLCADPDSGGAYAIDTLAPATVHAEVCALTFGALYCSCGAELTGSGPLYE
ncbi:hypothetical protein IU501_10895 [Nocardia otitidiscaviarum]|uniref:hypothetical protein n=1 Tax=Nocardia otitidiscaviarum TaxID=1823 RepID=UPI00189599FF|nr:hypothetical protein [Nocardia otitidiscaviarum]MBF6133506.1 hypothetical protein [Nocardia otitidiscaviarum]